MKYKEVAEYLRSIENMKTKDVDTYNKKLIKAHEDVSDLKDKALEDQIVHRTFFQVSLGQLKTYQEQIEFIEKNQDLLQDWWHVDQLLQFLRKPIDFSYAYDKAKNYVVSEKPYVRRWGYVIFLAGLQKDVSNTKAVLKLMKDDAAYYVQMAEAWVICDLAVYNAKEVYKFMASSKINYNILGKAVQKICDSFRISKEDKESFKSLRTKLRQN